MFTLITPPLPCLQDDDKNFRRAPSWRKKFRPKDVRGFSSDTLPANFKVTNSTSTSPAAQPKKHQLDGTRVFKNPSRADWTNIQMSDIFNSPRVFAKQATPTLANAPTHHEIRHQIPSNTKILFQGLTLSNTHWRSPSNITEHQISRFSPRPSTNKHRQMLSSTN